MPSRPWSGLLLLLFACGPTASPSDDGDPSTGMASATTPDPTADSTGPPVTGPPGGSLGMDHGVVLLRLERGASQTDDPFVGTDRVEVTMLYLECLIDFYESNPQWQQSGLDGSPVFDAALGMGLCDPSIPDAIACSAIDLRQELTASRQLTVTYDVTEPLEGRILRFGPLPTLGLAACDGGGPPTVRVGNTPARGVDAAGFTVWNVEAFNPDEAATDQGAPIVVRVARP